MTKNMIFRLVAFVICVLCSQRSFAQDHDQSNYDEAKVPKYTLPDPLVMIDGRPVTKADQWPARRKELLKLFEENMQGRIPTGPLGLIVEQLEKPTLALDGKAMRRQVKLKFTGRDNDPYIELLFYLPAKATKPCPVFIGYNFDGNHTVNADPAIRLATCKMRNNPEKGIVKNQATEKSRGSAASRWPIEQIIARGYGVVTACYQDNDPDYKEAYTYKVQKLFGQGESPDTIRRDDTGTLVGAWAWGMSRAMDYLETLPEIDAKRVIVHGHSRLGKTSLWAGATDERFALVISNDSGEGGPAITRRNFGERIKRINDVNPHWFCGKYKEYNEKENDMPVDAHELIALCAPRPVYVASAEGDKWADPRGEFLACYHAGPVYKLLGQEVIASDKMPAVNEPVHTRIGYHVRSGKHDITEYDWKQFMDFADKHLGKPK